mgnify:CR=1 FL=1
MAGIDTQKQLLSLIRDFTSERSRGGKIISLTFSSFCFQSRDFVEKDNGEESEENFEKLGADLRFEEI